MRLMNLCVCGEVAFYKGRSGYPVSEETGILVWFRPVLMM